MLPMNINTLTVLLWNGRVFCFIAGVGIHRLLVLYVCLSWLLLCPQYKLYNF